MSQKSVYRQRHQNSFCILIVMTAIKVATVRSTLTFDNYIHVEPLGKHLLLKNSFHIIIIIDGVFLCLILILQL